MNQNIDNVQQRINWLFNRVPWGDESSFVTIICHINTKTVEKSFLFLIFNFPKKVFVKVSTFSLIETL